MTNLEKAQQNAITVSGYPDTWFRLEDFCAVVGIKPTAVYNSKAYRTMKLKSSRRILVSWTEYTSRPKIVNPKGYRSKPNPAMELVQPRAKVSKLDAFLVMAEQKKRLLKPDESGNYKQGAL